MWWEGGRVGGSEEPEFQEQPGRCPLQQRCSMFVWLFTTKINWNLDNQTNPQP